MSATETNSNNRALYLHQIDITISHRVHFRAKLLIDDNNVDIEKAGHEQTWKPSRSLEIPSTGQVTVVLKAGHAILGVSVGKVEEKTSVTGQEITQAFWDSKQSEFSISRQVKFDDETATVTLQLRPSANSETMRITLNKLEDAVKEFKPVLTDLMQERIDTVVKYGGAIASMNTFAQMAFSVVTSAFEVVKEQKKFDDTVSGLADRIERIVPFIHKVETETLYDDTMLLKGIIKRMYNTTLDAAEFICSYVRRSPLKRTVTSVIPSDDRLKMTELGGELNKLIEDFDRAVGVEVLKKTTLVEDRFLRDRLNSIEAGYSPDQCCMPDTRKGILDSIISWAEHPVREDATNRTPNMYWLYGMPGVGKTSVASSICARLYEEKKLGGSFFCRRDDPLRSDPKYILSRFIFELAGMWRPYRQLIIDKLQKDSKLDPTSAGPIMFLQLLNELRESPESPLVLVVDAFDECGNPDTRAAILHALSQACSTYPWIRVVITSRPEQDIQSFFQKTGADFYLSQDLAVDKDAVQDITLFARAQLASIAQDSHLPDDWPGEELLGRITTRAAGLFIYIKTVQRLLKDELDPESTLTEILDGAPGNSEGTLYNLYSSAIDSRIGKNKEPFRQAIGVIIAVSPHRPLGDTAVATLAGLKVNVVQTLVDRLSSLLYRDDNGKGGIRVRHLSIIDFLTGPNCHQDVQVNVDQANLGVGLACLNTMNRDLKFNICKLESSLLANEEVKDLAQRVEENMSDDLQYSCLYWASHLSTVQYPTDAKLNDYLEDFFKGARPLYWIEALSLLGAVAVGTQALRRVSSWTKSQNHPILQRIKDTLRFMLAFQAPIMTSVPHIYISALPFTPTESNLWTSAQETFDHLIEVRQGQATIWPGFYQSWRGHGEAVVCIAYSPDGQHIVSGSRDNTLRKWDAETGNTMGEPWTGHTGGVSSVAYSPDGRYVASGSVDHTIRIWDAQTGGTVGEAWIVPTVVNSIAYSLDGRHIVSGLQNNTILMWDTNTGSVVGEPWTGHTGHVLSIACSPDGRHIASGSSDGTIIMWNLHEGKAIHEPWRGHTSSISSVAYSPDGSRVASGSFDKTIRIWDAKTGISIGEPWEGHIGIILSVAYSPDGHHLVSCGQDNTIRIRDVETGQAVGEPWKGHTIMVEMVIYSPDGLHVVSCSDDQTIRMWDAQTGKVIGEPSDDLASMVLSVAYSPDGHHIVSGCWDNTIRIWDEQSGGTGGQTWKGHTDPVKAVAYSPDGKYVISGSLDTTIRMWDAQTGIAVGEPWEGHSEGIISLAYSTDGQRIVSSSYDSTIRLWDVQTGKTIGEPWEHPCITKAFAYSPDGRYIISGDGEGKLRIRDVHTWSTVGEPWEGHVDLILSLAYSPDGRHVVSSSYDTIKMWDVQTRCVVGVPWDGHPETANSVAYSPDGRHVVSGSDEGTICIWDTETGKLLGEPWKGHKAAINAVAYSPDGRHVVSGSNDNTIQVSSATATTNEWRLASLPNKSRSDPSSNLAVDLLPDLHGWVHHPEGGLLFWVPEDCRHSLASPVLHIFPANGPNRIIRLDFSNFQYGTSWGKVKKLDS